MSTPAKPIRSMTGFAIVREDTEAGELTLSLRTVNHRGLDLHFHHSAEIAPFENTMRSVLKQHLGRGHVEVRTSIQRQSVADSGGLDTETLSRYVTAFRAAAKELALVAEPDLNVMLGLPGVLVRVEETQKLSSSFGELLMGALAQCARALNQSREREAEGLVAAVSTELAGIRTNTQEIADIRKTATEQFQQRLRDRLADLLGSAGISESRLAEEAAVLADRSDVQEEVTRLSVHAQELERILAEGGEVGKRLDFLLQELNREANTVLSKTSGSGEIGLKVTNLGLSIKTHIEKIREQALNLE